MRRFLLAAMLAATMVIASAGVAFAGEITGKGKPTAAPAHANSICAFSGQNDTPGGEDGGPVGRVQSWGALDKETRDFLRSIGVHPGIDCRGGSNPQNPPG